MRGVPAQPGMARALFLSVFFIATCGLIYELVAGALASYLVGDSVTWFSLVIGTYLSAMGVGSWLSRYIDRGLLSRFVEIEVGVALLGGFEALLLFAAFTFTTAFAPVLFALVATIGIGVGLELPLLMRILENQTSLKELLARVLFLDYLGALGASVAFPLLLLPHLGLLRTSLLFGLINGCVALWTTFLFELPPPARLRLRVLSVGALVLLLLGFALAARLEVAMETSLFADPVVMRQTTPYQKITLTDRGEDTRLYLNGALQFSSKDEYRYHEALVHPALAAVARPSRVLVLGGGDGLAAREIYRHPEVTSLTLVDLDPAMTRMFKEKDELAQINEFSLRDPRTRIINDDAFTWLGPEGEEQLYDAVIIDFPDPNNYALGKLYTTRFYRQLKSHLAAGAAVAIQATSPMYSPEAYWCIIRTLEQEGFSVRPYHAYVPSFGEWGFALASLAPLPPFRPLPESLRFLDAATLPTLFQFPRDMNRREGPVNRMDNQALVRLYDQDWKKIW